MTIPHIKDGDFKQQVREEVLNPAIDVLNKIDGLIGDLAEGGWTSTVDCRLMQYSSVDALGEFTIDITFTQGVYPVSVNTAYMDIQARKLKFESIEGVYVDSTTRMLKGKAPNGLTKGNLFVEFWKPILTNAKDLEIIEEAL